MSALSGMPGPRMVKALYDFRPSHTDELAFRKGDVICLTQTLEGGWWEGTLGGLTGWFPSNYVKPVKASSKVLDGHGQGRGRSVAEYQTVVLQQWVETERRYVAELFRLGNVLQELLDKGTSRLVESLGSVRLLLDDMHLVHQGLMSALDCSSRRPLADRQTGRELLTAIPKLKDVYEAYYSQHPRAAACLERREVQSVVASCSSLGGGSGAASGLNTLKAALAAPMRHVERFPQHLRELFRHVDVNHTDRGDIQLADKLLTDLLIECETGRRLKEAELDLQRGIVRGWPSDATAVGALVHSGIVRVLTAAGTMDDRLLLLFPKDLVFLSSISVTESPSYQLEGRLPLGVVKVNRVETLEGVENFEHAFELSGTSVEHRVILCDRAETVDRWLKCINECQNDATPKPMYNSMSLPRTGSTQQAPPPLPPHPSRSLEPPSARTEPLCLRPAPPMPPKLMLLRDDAVRSPRLSRKLQRKESARAAAHLAMEPPPPTPAALKDDMLILAVIEAYATQSRARHTMNLLDLTKIRLSDSELRQKQADAAFRISSDSSSSGGAAGGSQELLGAACTPTDPVASSPGSPSTPGVLPIGAHGGGACTCYPPSAPMTVKERKV